MNLQQIKQEPIKTCKMFAQAFMGMVNRAMAAHPEHDAAKNYAMGFTTPWEFMGYIIAEDTAIHCEWRELYELWVDDGYEPEFIRGFMTAWQWSSDPV